MKAFVTTYHPAQIKFSGARTASRYIARSGDDDEELLVVRSACADESPEEHRAAALLVMKHADTSSVLSCRVWQGTFCHILLDASDVAQIKGA